MKERKACDGTWQDYLRHRRHGETACNLSRISWARRQRRVRSEVQRRKANA